MPIQSALVIDHAAVAAIFSLKVTCVIAFYTTARVTMLARATLSLQSINQELSFAAPRAHATSA